MKHAVAFLSLASALLLLSCSGASKQDSATTTDSMFADTLKTAKVLVHDPDTTDNIPGDQYGVNTSDENIARLVRLTLQDQFKDDLARDLITSESRKFIFFQYDLNGDGKNEIFVGLTGSYFCGSGGCTVMLLDNEGNVINTFTVVDYPIVVDSKKSEGWNDLFMLSGGKYHIMKFNGKKYPSNPSVQTVLDLIPGDNLPRVLNYMNEPYPWFKF